MTLFSDFCIIVVERVGKGCPNCGSSGNMTRILSLSSFQLKGGGWAADNYEKSKKSSEKTWQWYEISV